MVFAPAVEKMCYIYIEKGKQINQKYTSNICKYISTFVLVNTDQTLNCGITFMVIRLSDIRSVMKKENSKLQQFLINF